MLILHAVGFCVCGGGEDGRGVDYHSAVFGSFRRDAERGEGGTKDGNEGWSDVGAECGAD